VNKAEQENSIDAKQIELLSSILEFPTIKVKDVMIARVKIGYIDSDMTYTEIVAEIKRDNHSRYPVCAGALENSIGVLHVKDLLQLTLPEIERFDIKRYIKNPFIVYEHMKIQSVFDHMKKKRIHLALVKDENGTVVGMITLEDIIEQIVGDIQDEHDGHEKNKMSEQHAEQMANEGSIVDATISLLDLESDCDIELPNEEGYSTLAGFILDMLGNNFPEEGQMLFWNGLSFEIEKVENGEIKLVKIKDTEGERHIFSRKQKNES
jgi:CBS domain containing-hemolysin-like protein